MPLGSDTLMPHYDPTSCKIFRFVCRTTEDSNPNVYNVPCHVHCAWVKYSLITLEKVFVFNEHIHTVVRYKFFRLNMSGLGHLSNKE